MTNGLHNYVNHLAIPRIICNRAVADGSKEKLSLREGSSLLRYG